MVVPAVDDRPPFFVFRTFWGRTKIFFGMKTGERGWSEGRKKRFIYTMKYNTGREKCYTHAIQVFRKYSALFFWRKKEIKKYIILFASGKKKIYKRHAFTFLKIRGQMLVYVVRWARLGILVKVCNERKF